MTPNLECVDKKYDKQPLEVQGGSPTSEILIKEGEVNTKRTGIQGIFKFFSSKVKSQLLVSFKPHTSLDTDIKFHMQFMPSTCLVQKNLLHFVSGYRNYAGQQLLKQTNLGNYKQPAGSVTLSCFPKIIDNIDILETLVIVWAEDVYAKLNNV